MNTAWFRFYADLGDFLPPDLRGGRSGYRFRGNPSVKDAIEAQGIPHPEVELILVNGEVVGFAHRLRDGDLVSVYPAFRALAIAGVYPLRDRLPDPARFILDIHLGRLAAYLRLFGFDSLYQNDLEDARIAQAAVRERRIVLTRDRGLLKRGSIEFGYCVRSSVPREQLLEVLERYRLRTRIEPFKHCMRCNGLLQLVTPDQVLPDIPESVREQQREFRRCAQCGQVYWRGSHYDRLQGFVQEVVRDLDAGRSPVGTQPVER